MESAKIKAVGEYVILEILPQKSVLVGAANEGLKVVSIGANVSPSTTLMLGDIILVRPGSTEPISIYHLNNEGKSYCYVAATDIVCRVDLENV